MAGCYRCSNEPSHLIQVGNLIAWLCDVGCLVYLFIIFTYSHGHHTRYWTWIVLVYGESFKNPEKSWGVCSPETWHFIMGW